jgi:hypothetical protein
MLRVVYVAAVATVVWVVTGLSSTQATAPLGPVAVQVPQSPPVTQAVTITFHPRGRLPRRGYYYAVIVLERYEQASLKTPPSCAVSSDMRKTAYGYSRGNHRIHLTLTPAESASNHWCPGGTYTGAIYAVPHKPPCNGYYSCYGKSAVNGSCWEVEGGHVVCGVVAHPKEEQAEREAKENAEREARERAEHETKQPSETEAKEKAEREAKERAEAREAASYSYPGGLPKPIDHSTHIVGHFAVRFPSPPSS